MCIASDHDHKSKAMAMRTRAVSEIETILFSCYIAQHVSEPILDQIRNALSTRVLVGSLGELPPVVFGKIGSRSSRINIPNDTENSDAAGISVSKLRKEETG